MIINRVALKRQSTVIMLLILIFMTGLYAYQTIPRESFPDIEIPYIFVTTAYEGVAPADIESLVTIPLERQLKGLDGVEAIYSSSAEGFSTVAIEFSTTVDLDDALQKVKDKVDQAKPDLPTDLPADPSVTEFSFTQWPVMRVVLSGPFPLRRLKTMADEIKDRIEALPGVLEAELSGGLDREIHVELDLDRVAAYNVPFSSLIAAVQQSNVNMPGGSLNIGDSRYMVRVPEDFQDPAEISSIVAFSYQGRPVYLRDLAAINDTYKDPLTRARINGQNSVTLAVMKRTGENIIEVSDGVRKIVEEMKPLLPPTLQIDLTSDMADDVRYLVAELENNILTGLVLILAVIFLFIGGTSAIIVALAIPLSLLITFSLLWGAGITLNMVVLFSLILSLGMLVDNGIVIVENIYRHMQQGASRREAAEIGTDQVAWPVIASTMTTLGAFVPLLFWSGIMGEFMKFLPTTLIMSLTASLFVALTVNPVLSARYQTIRVKVAKNSSPEREPWIKRGYLVLLKFALNNRLLIVLLVFTLLFCSIAAFGRFGKGVEFFPSVEPSRAYIYIKAPEGTNLNASDKIVAEIEKRVSGYEDIEYVISNIGAEGGNPFEQGGTGTHISRVALDFKDYHDRSRHSTEIVDEIRTNLLRDIRGAEIQVTGEEHGPPTGAVISLEISGDDILVLGELAASIRKEIQGIPGLVDLKDNFVRGKPEIRVRVDKEKAALLNLNAFTIGYTVKAAINGVKVGNYREHNDEYPIMVKLPASDCTSLESLKRLTISGPTGEPIPLTSVAELSMEGGLGSIMRIDQKRVVTITGDTSGRLANDIITDIKNRLTDFPMPNGFSYEFTGQQKEQAEAQAFLSKAFIAAIFIIFLVLVTEFNSLITPLIILTSVILSLIGVFLGLLITGKPFGITMTGIGVISLAGVVVNNAIVLIAYYQELMDRGLSSREALERAGMVRFRPVMLTALTTILGLVPMATGISFNFRKFYWEIGGESSQMWSNMAIAVIFGLAVATLLTLVVVPVLCSISYSVLNRKTGKEAGPKKRFYLKLRKTKI